MENHPIPQDVTGFQFKLIGNMTVKQFAYLASGVVFAWILLQMPINIFIKFPLCAFSAILGIGLAYFPVGGRPMDLMIGNYLKALFRPTQFIYEKTGGQIYFPHKTSFADIKSVKQHKSGLGIFPKDKLKAHLESMEPVPSPVANASPYQSNVLIVQDQKIPQINPLGSDLPKLLNNTPPAEPLPLEQVRVSNPQPNAVSQPVSPKPQQDKPAAVATPPIIIHAPKSHSRNIGILNTPDSPSLITGVAKDARNNALPNILVEIKDKDGNPVRAFKTNEFGRFASATPLINGAYTIEFEDPKGQNKFEKITVNIIGQVILPITAVSIDTREELRRSLFSPPAGGLTN